MGVNIPRVAALLACQSLDAPAEIPGPHHTRPGHPPIWDDERLRSVTVIQARLDETNNSTALVGVQQGKNLPWK